AGMSGTKNQIIIQVWHAAGAVKTFGSKDEQVKLRRQPDRDRFQFIYDQVDYTVVGSDRMGEIFMEAFNTTNENLIRTGVPRTDFFFNELEMQKVKKRIEDTYSFMKNKKVNIYASTSQHTTTKDQILDN